MEKSLTILIFIVFVFFSCNNKAQTNSGRGEMVLIQKTSESVSAEAHALTKNEVELFFPKQLGDYRLFNVDVSLLKSKGTASGIYIRENDYDHSLSYTLEDGNRKGSAILKNFEDGYKSTTKGPKGTEYIRKERNGYKTIAFLQHNINRYTVSFIYNQRFLLSLEGVEKPDVLWSYFEKEDLQKLNALN
jgi:hypothetical protein